MPLSIDFLNTVALAATRCPGPHIVPWPTAGNPGGFISFGNFVEWQDFVLKLSLRDGIPEIVRAKFERAQKVHIVAWLEFDLIKAGELVALTALELALTDRYGPKAREKYGNMAFAYLLRYMPERDGLTDDKLPMDPSLRRYGRRAWRVRPADARRHSK